VDVAREATEPVRVGADVLRCPTTKSECAYSFERSNEFTLHFKEMD